MAPQSDPEKPNLSDQDLLDYFESQKKKIRERIDLISALKDCLYQVGRANLPDVYGASGEETGDVFKYITTQTMMVSKEKAVHKVAIASEMLDELQQELIRVETKAQDLRYRKFRATGIAE